MNFDIKDLPTRAEKPRSSGMTMVMDKGLSIREVHDFISVAEPFTDIVKLGFGTSYVTPNLKEKLDAYRDANIPFYFGGTLFEAFVVRGQFEDFLRLLEKYQLEYAEVSDGSFVMSREQKCKYIREMSKHVKVLSEVGSKDEEEIIPPYKWIEFMQEELEAGSWKLIAEARESGNVGIYRATGEVRSGLIQEILTQIPEDKIIFEAPQKKQQVWFVNLIGANVNLGNIAPNDVLPVETLRLGLRADTFDSFRTL